jgi:sugar O-acyltransferase (sialic acid O-acetyltransferase NeuD family)
MERVPLFVFGASAHGKVVAEAARQTNAFAVKGFLDDERAKWNTTFHGVPVMGGLDAVAKLPAGAQVALGIGANRARSHVFGRLTGVGARIATIVHPSASVSRGAVVGDGTFVGPLAVVHVDARVGRGCIVNSGAVIEHDNVLGDWVHVSPNATLGGTVTVGTGSHVGLGACVLPNLTIGSWCVVGAGSVVRRPLADLSVAVGVPARVIRTYESQEHYTH